jgi:hypothetical protein
VIFDKAVSAELAGGGVFHQMYPLNLPVHIKLLCSLVINTMADIAYLFHIAFGGLIRHPGNKQRTFGIGSLLPLPSLVRL